MLTAYQEGLLSLDELRERMPNLRRRERADNAELQAIVDQSGDRAVHLRLAEMLTTFLARLRSSAGALDVPERQRVIRLLVKEVLVDDGKIIVRHGIPLPMGPINDPAPRSRNSLAPSSRLSFASEEPSSPMLANLFLHYAFDMWMTRTFPHIPFERYADDVICHCKSAEEARALWSALADRFTTCKLVCILEKTKIVYCKDANRRGDFPNQSFDFLGFTFRERRTLWQGGLPCARLHARG